MWTKKTTRAGTVYSRVFPAGIVTVRQRTSSGFRAWVAQFPNGKEFRESTHQAAMDYADSQMARAESS